MPLTIIMDNLANLSKHVDAIVNLCHPTPGEIGTGVDAAIHAKAGPRLRQRLAELPRLHVGEFHYTDGYDLTNALGEKVAGIFHVRGPLWQNGALGEEAQLRKCYLDLLEAAHGRGVKSIAFPMISAGNRGFPEDVAYRAATDAFREFFDQPKHQEMQAYLVIFGGKVVDYCKRQTQVEEAVDAATVESILKSVYTVPVETTYERMLASFMRWITQSGKFDQYLIVL
jgi:O-acetyl-ADP-ribose deacetylase (regulator of RNase III)